MVDEMARRLDGPFLDEMKGDLRRKFPRCNHNSY
jgi:hypothetical protein